MKSKQDSNNETALFGIDEAGRGCLAGPVLAACVLLKKNYSELLQKSPLELDDSKKLSKNQREELVPLIKSISIAYAYGLSWNREIDAVNILNATFRAMSRSILSIKRKLEADSLLPKLWVDGNICIRHSEWQACAVLKASHWHQGYFPLGFFPANDSFNALVKEEILSGAYTHGLENIDFPFASQKAVVGGDALHKSISAASILAKVKRDELMLSLNKIVPGYDLDKHKGYASKDHVNKIISLGPSPIHRLSFLRKILNKNKYEQSSLI